MKTTFALIRFDRALRLASQLFSRVACLGAAILICSSASAENLFVASDNIYEFTPSGVRSTFSTLSGAIAFDRAGNLFVLDFGGNIYKITPVGSRTTFASGLVNGPLDFATGLACDSGGNLFVTTGEQDDFGFPIIGSGKIYEFTPSGVRTIFASGLDFPTALAFDSAGNLFVANIRNFNNDVIYKFTPAGGRTVFASGITNPEAVAIDNANNLFVSAAVLGGNGGVIY